MNSLVKSTIILLLVCFNVVRAADEIFPCNSTVACPESAPCCSQYGQCGTGAYCLGGCDIRYSFNISACMPRPTCHNKTTDFSTTDVLLDLDTYLGNASASDWVYTGYVLENDDYTILAMPNNSGGTVISSTDYVWYGKVSTVMRTSHLKGVVTANILFSDVQDEIDFEWVGADLLTSQTNFYALGYTNYTNSANITMTNSTFDNFHLYEVDWSEDQIVWSVDGVQGRVLKKADTWNSTLNRYMYPQTPARVEISIWPGGDTSQAIGTVDWAGGYINWDAPDISDPGYYYAMLKSITIECYDPPSGTEITGSGAYVYADNATANPSQGDVSITDDSTILGSLGATGFDPDFGMVEESHTNSSSNSTNSSSNSTSSSSTSTAADSVPTGAGTGARAGSNNANDDSDNTDTTSTAGTATTSTNTNTNTGFVQNGGSTATSSSSIGSAGSTIANGLLALIAIMVSMAL